jgi:DNA-binding CsgD family transcriptional regulator/PAS domain-containing protein
MPRTKNIHALIRMLYECAVDPCQWPSFCKAYAEAVGAQMAGLVVQDLRNPGGQITAGHGVDPFWERRYGEYYAGLNVWWQRGQSVLKQPGAVIPGDWIVTDAALVKTEFYADFLRPQKLFYTDGGTITREDAVASYFTSARGKKAGPFGADEHATLQRLMPHFTTALRVHQRIVSLEARAEQAADLLDSAAQGVIATDVDGAVLFMNQTASEMLGLSGTNRTGASGGLTLGHKGLSAQHPREATRLRELIARAGDTIAGNGVHSGGVMLVSREGKAPLKVLVAPLSSVRNKLPVAPFAAGSGRRPAVVLFISAPERNPVPMVDQIAGQLQLTPAEARLAAALVEGKSMKEFAEEAEVTLNTARTHLKRVFHKAGVSRQGELIRFLLTGSGKQHEN